MNVKISRKIYEKLHYEKQTKRNRNFYSTIFYLTIQFHDNDDDDDNNYDNNNHLIS